MAANQAHPGKVLDFTTHKNERECRERQIIRLAPECDGLSVLYSNRHSSPEKLFTMKIPFWCLRDNGEVVAAIPWLNRVTPSDELDDPIRGKWEGYYDEAADQIMMEPPPHKVMELKCAAAYFENSHEPQPGVVQEIPDTIGTHALLAGDDSSTLVLTEVSSWRLMGDGSIHGMLINEDEVVATPVLPGDDCLHAADENKRFRYYFQHHIANQIKAEDPAALAAIISLFEP